MACGHDSKLTGGLFGGIEAELNWSEDELECDSMLRPNSEGIRLRFAGDVAGERLSIIVSLPQLQEGIEAVETAANVTLTVEGSGRFFTTPNLNACWAEITTQTPLDGAQHAYLVDGNLLCVSALGELNGESAISIPSLQFTTVADWTSK